MCTRTRRWCCFENAVGHELVGRGNQVGFEEVKEQMALITIAKIYEISGPDVPAVPIEVRACPFL